MNKIIFSFFLIGIIFSCKSQKNATATSADADTVLLASIEHTPCFGTCGTYKIIIYQSGYVIYEGIKYVPNIGKFYTRIDKSKTEEIKNYILNNKVLQMEDKYVNPHIADFPSTYTEANVNGTYKHIVDTDPEAPEALKNYEKFLDSFFTEETKWTLLEESRQ